MTDQSAYLQPKESARLYLRPLSFNDIDAWREFTADEEALRYFPEEFRLNPNGAEDWIEKQIDRYRANTFGLLALIEKQSGAFVGQCGLLLRSEFDKPELEVGYSLIRRFWGKGYAIEAARFCRDYAFKNDLSNSIISLINPENLPSIKVAETNGMVNKGLVKFYDMDHGFFQISKNDWKRNISE